MGRNGDVTRMPDGRYRRDIGWKPNSRGGYMQHRFYLGRDRSEALVRNIQLDRTWDATERRWQRWREQTHHAGERPVWDATTLLIAQAVARGEAIVQVVPTEDLRVALENARKSGSDSLLRSWQGGVVEWLRRLQDDFPHVRIELADGDLQRVGEEEVRRWIGSLERELDALQPGPAASGQSLHQALDGYSQWIQQNYLAPGGEVSPGGNKMLREVKILKEHHEDRPLECFGVNEIEAMLAHWKHRPMTRRGRPCSPDTSRDMIKQVRTFVRWLHKSPSFRWRKPADLESTLVRIAVTPEEVSARLSNAQVETYTLDELCILYEYASPWERLLMLLGLNCGFGVAEVSTLLTTEIHLRQTHGHYPREGSWVKRVRFKSSVYEEWSLWPATVAGIEWQLARRGQTEHKALLLSRRGLPLSTPTKGNNRNNKVPNAWGSCYGGFRRTNRSSASCHSTSSARLGPTSCGDSATARRRPCSSVTAAPSRLTHCWTSTPTATSTRFSRLWIAWPSTSPPCSRVWPTRSLRTVRSTTHRFHWARSRGCGPYGLRASP